MGIYTSQLQTRMNSNGGNFALDTNYRQIIKPVSPYTKMFKFTQQIRKIICKGETNIKILAEHMGK